MHRCVLLLLLLCCLKSFSQTKTIAGLKEKIAAAAPDEKLRALFALCDQGYTLHPDTLMAYAQRAEALAVTLHDKTKARYYQSFALTNKGLIDSSLHIAESCLDETPGKWSDAVLEADLLNQKGRCFMRKNQYKEAIAMGYRVVETAEKTGNKLQQIKGKTLIGWAYLELSQPREALTWHLNALHTAADTALLQKYAILYANLALNYKNLGRMDSAFYYIKKAIAGARQYENLFALSNALAIQAQLVVTAGQPKLAEAPLKEVVAIRKLVGDPFYIVSDMAQLALYYAHYGQTENGIALCREGLAIASKYKMDTKRFLLYSTLAENYKAAGNTPAYATTLETILALKDSIYQTNSAEALAEMQAKYNIQKKETIIIRQKFDLARKNYILTASLLLFLMIAVACAFMFRDYKRKQQVRTALMQQEEKQRSAQAVAEAEEAERKRIAADLHDNLGVQANAILYGTELLQQEPEQKGVLVADLHHTAKDMLTSLRETVWVLKSNAIVAPDIWLRLINFSKQLNRHYPAVQINTDGAAPPQLQLSSARALNVVFIVQEALNNAVRHSGAQLISISSSFTSAQWQLCIWDNGCGFDPAALYKKQEHYGLNNMKERAAAAALRLIIKTGTEGTRIELLVHAETD